MKKRLSIVFLVVLLLLSGCGNPYSEEDLEDAKQQAYREGYNDGYYRGAEEQKEKDYEELLIDGYSIRDIEEEIYNEYGMTPHEAFTILDEYEYDSSHGGYTWTEYQYAIEVMYATASIFPYDY